MPHWRRISISGDYQELKYILLALESELIARGGNVTDISVVPNVEAHLLTDNLQDTYNVYLGKENGSLSFHLAAAKHPAPIFWSEADIVQNEKVKAFFFNEVKPLCANRSVKTKLTNDWSWGNGGNAPNRPLAQKALEGLGEWFLSGFAFCCGLGAILNLVFFLLDALNLTDLRAAALNSMGSGISKVFFFGGWILTREYFRRVVWKNSA